MVRNESDDAVVGDGNYGDDVSYKLMLALMGMQGTRLEMVKASI